MSATITTLPSRSSESSVEAGERRDRDAVPVQGFEAGSERERDSFIAETAIKIDRLQETDRQLVSIGLIGPGCGGKGHHRRGFLRR